MVYTSKTVNLNETSTQTFKTLPSTTKKIFSNHPKNNRNSGCWNLRKRFSHKTQMCDRLRTFAFKPKIQWNRSINSNKRFHKQLLHYTNAKWGYSKNSFAKFIRKDSIVFAQQIEEGVFCGNTIISKDNPLANTTNKNVIVNE